MDKYYTVDDVAQMTGLTSRTIRNYLKDGTLKGKKVGVQWRFTEEDISKLFKEQKIQQEISDAKNQLVYEFLENQNKESEAVCMVWDLPTNDKSRLNEICTKIMNNINEYKDGDIRFSYQYFEDTKLARFIFCGKAEKVLELIALAKN